MAPEPRNVASVSEQIIFHFKCRLFGYFVCNFIKICFSYYIVLPLAIQQIFIFLQGCTTIATI